MKHIKRKFLSEIKLTDEQIKKIETKGLLVTDRESMKKIKVAKDLSPILVTESNKGIKAFIYKEGNIQYFIPEPDPILIYFNNAQANLKEIEKSRIELFTSLSDESLITDKIKHSLYQYFGSCSAYVIFCLQQWKQRLIKVFRQIISIELTNQVKASYIILIKYRDI